MTRLRLLWPVALVALVVGYVAAYPMGAQQPSTSPPLFTVGTSYVVIWDCSIIVVQDHVGQGCYSEPVTVQAIRSDGWLLVTDDQGDGWPVNPARMIGFKVATTPLRAAR